MNPFVRAGQALGLLVREDETTTPPAGIESKIPPRLGADAPLSLDSVFGAVFLFETAASQLSIDAWRGDDKIDRPAVLDNPDVFSHRPAFFAETVGSLSQRGEAFWKHYTNPAGVVTGLKVLDPLTGVEPLGGGRFRVDGKEQTGGISHLQLLRRPGQLHGLGPLQACMETVQGAIELRRWADNWLDQGQIPNGQLTTDKDLNETTAKRYKAQFTGSQSYRNGPVVLGSGLKYSPMLLKPEEMQWLEAQNFNVLAVARMFGIPPRRLLAVLEGGADTYANMEQDDISFVRFTFMRYVTEIEAAFTALLPRGQVARINLDALLRTDTKTRYEAHQIGIQAGFLTVPEVRAIEHLGPKPETA